MDRRHAGLEVHRGSAGARQARPHTQGSSGSTEPRTGTAVATDGVSGGDDWREAPVDTSGIGRGGDSLAANTATTNTTPCRSTTKRTTGEPCSTLANGSGGQGTRGDEYGGGRCSASHVDDRCGNESRGCRTNAVLSTTARPAPCHAGRVGQDGGGESARRLATGTAPRSARPQQLPRWRRRDIPATARLRLLWRRGRAVAQTPASPVDWNRNRNRRAHCDRGAQHGWRGRAGSRGPHPRHYSREHSGEGSAASHRHQPTRRAPGDTRSGSRSRLVRPIDHDCSRLTANWTDVSAAERWSG